MLTNDYSNSRIYLPPENPDDVVPPEERLVTNPETDINNIVDANAANNNIADILGIPVLIDSDETGCDEYIKITTSEEVNMYTNLWNRNLVNNTNNYKVGIVNYEHTKSIAASNNMFSTNIRWNSFDDNSTMNLIVSDNGGPLLTFSVRSGYSIHSIYLNNVSIAPPSNNIISIDKSQLTRDVNILRFEGHVSNQSSMYNVRGTIAISRI